MKGWLFVVKSETRICVRTSTELYDVTQSINRASSHRFCPQEPAAAVLFLCSQYVLLWFVVVAFPFVAHLLYYSAVHVQIQYDTTDRPSIIEET
jgi:hypothetical protein